MKPPRLADWLLARMLPEGKRGDSMRGDLLEEFSRLPDSGSRTPRLWYWQQTIRLTVRYLFSPSPQDRLSCPRRAPMWFDLLGDVKTAVRAIVRAPGTSLLIVLTLGSAIAAATIGFTFADLALLRGLPIDDPSKVVTIFASDTQGANPRARVSGPDFLDIQARTTTLTDLAAFRDGRAPLIRNGQSQTLSVSYATAGLFSAMGQRAIRGRVFQAGDDQPGAAPVVLLAHHYWQREMMGRDAVLGTTMQIGREHFTVVGVLSPDIEFGNVGEIEAWLPLRIDPSGARDARTMRFLARLEEGNSFEQAAAELSAISDALSREHPATNGGWKLRLAPARDLTGGPGFWVVISLFLLSIGLLLAIATANVSNLALSRSMARIRELAVRSALGARRGRLVRQFITEGFLLSGAAAMVSLPLALAGIRAIQATSAEAVFRQLTIDMHELSFVALIALIGPLVFSIAPSRLLSRHEMRQVLAASGVRGATASTRGRGALVVLQVALAVILLTVSSIALRAIREIYTAPIGLETAKVMLLGLEFNDALYPENAQSYAAAHETRDRLAALPGVTAVAMITALPILGDAGPVPLVLDTAIGDANDVKPNAVVTSTSPEAPAALGVTMLAGSWWSAGDTNVAVVSRAAAERYLGGVTAAIGRTFKITETGASVAVRVIGVSSDVANTDRTSAPPPRVWLPLTERSRRFAYVVRGGDHAVLTPQIRSTVAATAAAVPIEYLESFDESLRQAASSDYVIIGSLTGFALLALLLASAGLFGVVSYNVAQRTAEFGTRMALGATATDVVRLVARQSLTLLVIGAAIGIAAGVGVGYIMASSMSEITPLDPIALGSVVALLGIVTVVATAWPALRASRIDPIVTLRAE